MNAAFPRVTARPANFPVATGGWNAIDALDAMAPNEAETLRNWFPGTTFLRLRGGSTEFCDTGTGEPVTSLAAYASGSADALLAYSDGRWWDVTSGTAASLATVGTSGYWDTTNFATAAGQYLLAVNGDATPQVFNGTTMVNAVNTIGGSAPTIAFSAVCAYNQRIYYAEANSLSLWYLPVGQFQGALTEFDLGPLAVQGGKIVAIGTWTRDNASAGANEMFVAVTDQGEVFVFTGLFPGGVWNIAARFVVGRPVKGPRCLTRMGPDMVLICEDGFQPLGQYLQLGQSQAQRVALSRKIGNAVTQAVTAYGAENGWCATLHPALNMLLFNVPQTGGFYYQYVANTLTGAWCEYRGMNGLCWVSQNGALYYGAADGAVYLGENGTSDNGADIIAEYRGAYQYIGGEGLIKRATTARPVFQTTGPITVSFGIDVDFNNTSLTAPVSSFASGALWGSGLWGVATWGSGLTLQQNWISVSAIGYAMAPHFVLQTGTIQARLMNIGLLVERGAFI
jgi:hypothetical protein